MNIIDSKKVNKILHNFELYKRFYFLIDVIWSIFWLMKAKTKANIVCLKDTLSRWFYFKCNANFM